MIKGGTPPGKTGTVRPVHHEALDGLAQILDLVRRGLGHSRSEIAVTTGLSRAVVSQRVGALIARGLLTQSLASSTGGRPPARLEFVAANGYLLVAYLGATSIDVAVSDLSGEISGHFSEPADIAAGPEEILARVTELFATAAGTAQPSGRLWGIGIAVPGPVRFRTGRPVAPPIMPGWDGYPIREHFTQAYGVPTWVDNDVNVMALGEWRAGVARGHQNVLFIKVGTGIGAGIISDGAIHRGDQGCAGDIGHIQVVDDQTIVCRCGNIGCLEAVAGGAALARDAAALARSGRSVRLAELLAKRGRLTGEDVSWAAEHGDPASVELLQNSGRAIGRVVASLVNFFNPSVIVIGGGVANAGDYFLAVIRGITYQRSLPLATRELQIQRSSLGGTAGITGAAAMVLDQLFSREHLSSWIESGRPDGTSLRLLAS
jgi:glucokinase-like ROK family protein